MNNFQGGFGVLKVNFIQMLHHHPCNKQACVEERSPLFSRGEEPRKL